MPVRTQPGQRQLTPTGKTDRAGHVVDPLGDGDDSVLAGVVGRAESGVEAGNRGGVHDVPAVRHQMRKEGTDAVHDAPEVHAEDPLPRRERTEPGIGSSRDARVVADQIDLAEAVDHLVGEGEHLCLLADVDLHREGLHVGLTDLSHGDVERVLLDVGKHDRHALGREPGAQRPPDPAGGTCHDRDLALPELHAAPPSRAGTVL